MIVRRCSMCSDEAGVVHFNLLHRPVIDGRMTQRGAGSIDLCPRCWKEVTTRSAERKRRRRVPFRTLAVAS